MRDFFCDFFYDRIVPVHFNIHRERKTIKLSDASQRNEIEMTMTSKERKERMNFIAEQRKIEKMTLIISSVLACLESILQPTNYKPNQKLVNHSLGQNV